MASVSASLIALSCAVPDVAPIPWPEPDASRQTTALPARTVTRTRATYEHACCRWCAAPCHTHSVDREAPRRPGDPSTMVASNRKIRDVLGWQPAYDDLEFMVRTRGTGSSGCTRAAGPQHSTDPSLQHHHPRPSCAEVHTARPHDRPSTVAASINRSRGICFSYADRGYSPTSSTE